MQNIHDIVNTVKDALTGKKRQTMIISTILITMTICACIIALFQKIHQSKKETVPAEEKELVIDQPLLLPDSPAVPKGYIFSREKNGRWDTSDALQWFTIPGKNAVDELGKANDRIDSDITGAAP